MEGTTAALMIVGCVLPSIIDILISIITDAVKENYNQHDTVQSLLQDLKLNLLPVRKLALYLAERRLADDPEYSVWLQQINDVIDEADSLLHQFEDAKVQLEVSTSSVNNIKNFLFTDPRIIRLKKMVEKLDKIVTRAVHFIKLFEQGGYGIKDIIDEITESTILMNDEGKEEIFFGRDKEKNIILVLLLSAHSNKKQRIESSSRNPLLVLPIVGIEGIGKTSLAKVIYNDQTVKDHFHLTAWVHVGDNCDAKKFIFDIISSLSISFTGFEDFDSFERMVDTLVNIISDQMFFLVLDGVVDESGGQWTAVMSALRQGRNGSAVILTTRSSRVAEMMGTIGPIHLDVVSGIDYWTLFKYHAFQGARINGLSKEKRMVLESIGDDISKKLNGLPLAARDIGCLLNNRFDEDYWHAILASEWWTHEKAANEFLAWLRLSYEELDENLKHCFASCSIFPRNCLFEKQRVVQMWIEGGCIQSSNNKRAADKGNECFDELTRRSFFMYAGDEKYVMHDLMLNLAMAENECMKSMVICSIESPNCDTIKEKIVRIFRKCFRMVRLLSVLS